MRHNGLHKRLAPLRHLSPRAAKVLRAGLWLCCGLLGGALLLLLCGRPISLETYPLYVRAAQLQRAALTVYICTGFTASFLEEHALKE